ncbi:hypothetical protein AX15_001681 [Amanita polypyramis BW_CC]|nr:hypothetical protein AX15_001681 [Amanita polypyramis BW_CC]
MRHFGVVLSLLAAPIAAQGTGIAEIRARVARLVVIAVQTVVAALLVSGAVPLAVVALLENMTVKVLGVAPDQSNAAEVFEFYFFIMFTVVAKFNLFQMAAAVLRVLTVS